MESEDCTPSHVQAMKRNGLKTLFVALIHKPSVLQSFSLFLE
jgi:hypothetical protein